MAPTTTSQSLGAQISPACLFSLMPRTNPKPQSSPNGRDQLLGIRGLVIIGLVEQEVGSELLVLVTGEISLNSLVAVKAQAAKLSHISLNNPDRGGTT